MFGDYGKFYQNIFPNSFNPATGLVALAGYNNRNDRTNLFSQTDLVWESRWQASTRHCSSGSRSVTRIRATNA